MPGSITTFFRRLSVKASIGVHPQEQAAPQRVLIDFEYDSPESAEGDRLDTVLDYDGIREKVAAIAAKGHFNLQETLCREILAALLAYPQVTRAAVEIRKPDIYPDVDEVGVRMEATKS